MVMRKPAAALARAAFTLMEMLVVVAILVVLAGAAVPIYLNYLDRAKTDRVKADFKVLETAINKYYMDFNEYPGNLRVLTGVLPDGGRPILEAEAILDPWRHEYQMDASQIHPQSRRPKLMSQGPPGGPPINNC
jgi:general secretion pathway protein G